MYNYDWGLDGERDFLSYDEEVEQMTEREAYHETLHMLRLLMKRKNIPGRDADWDTVVLMEEHHPVAVRNAIRTFFTPEPLV